MCVCVCVFHSSTIQQQKKIKNTNRQTSLVTRYKSSGKVFLYIFIRAITKGMGGFCSLRPPPCLDRDTYGPSQFISLAYSELSSPYSLLRNVQWSCPVVHIENQKTKTKINYKRKKKINLEKINPLTVRNTEFGKGRGRWWCGE